MIEEIEATLTDTKTYKCKCDKTGVKFERVEKKDGTGMDERPSNTEVAFCDKEIIKFRQFILDMGYGGECWCKHIKEYVDASI